MPIQAPQWTDYLNCPACCREFSPRRSPISLSCGHTLCRPCIKNLIKKQCPFDQSVISMDLEELVVNTALLQLMGYDPPAQPSHPPSIQRLPEQDRWAYDIIVKCLEQLAVFLKYCCTASVNMIGNRLSRPMQRKLVTLLQCALMDEEGRGKAARAARSLGERTVSELILQHQNPQQLSANLWAAVRSRGCQFLGPAMQEEVLKLVLLALEDGSPLSRKVLVMFVVQRLEPHFPQASKTSIGHVVQLLYRASCFKVSKRESDSSLMQLKEEFRTYECLRREHDAQIVQIATESGLRIAPDQWSALLYGDTLHKSHMQSIIDKLQTPHSFAQSVQELFFALQRTGDPSQMLVMSMSLDRLTSIDPSPDAKSPSWHELSLIMTALKDMVSGLVDYMQHHAAARDANHNLKNDRLPDASTMPLSIANHLHGRYKVAMCRDAQAHTFCPRGNNCTYAHTEEELERYRRQDSSNLTPMYASSPQPPLTLEINKLNMMPMQQPSPSGRQHSKPDNGDTPNKFEFEHAHRRPSPDSHHADVPRSNHRDMNWSYANALEFGAANKRQRHNENREGWNRGTEYSASIKQPIASTSPPIRKPGEMMQHNIWTVSVNQLCGGGILSPPKDDMQPPSKEDMRPPLSGGIDPLNVGMQSPNNRGMQLPSNGGMQPPSYGGTQPPSDGSMKPPSNGSMQPHSNGSIQPPSNGSMQPPSNGGMQPPIYGGMLPPSYGGMQPSNYGIMQTPSYGEMQTPSYGGMHTPSNGGMQLPSHGGMQPPSYRGMQAPSYGGTQAPNNGGMQPSSYGGMQPTSYGSMQFPNNGGMRPLLNGWIDPINGPMVPASGGMVPLNGGLTPVNGRMVAPNMGIGNYGNQSTTINTIADAMHHINGGHEPPTDSRYFPRQSSENTANLQQQNQSAGTGGMPAFQEFDADYEVPEFVPRKNRPKVQTPEQESMEAFGLGPETRSRFEYWQPPPPPVYMHQPRSIFRFSVTVKNLPEGLYPCDLVPVELTDSPQYPYQGNQNLNLEKENMYRENQNMAHNYSMNSQMMYIQPVIDRHTPSMEMPGPTELNPYDENVNMDFEPATNGWQNYVNPDDAVLDDLHRLAVRVTTLGSDTEAE